MNLKSIAALALAEDAASDPEFEEKHPRGNSANKGQFRKSEKTLAKLDEADASIRPDDQTASSQSPAAEYAAVEAKYKGTPEWMKAPNGKPTNLTERQWVQVRTPSFKAWFGDWVNDPEHASKVIDSNGEPKVVYHGSTEEFSTFDVTKSGRSNDTEAKIGFWFAESESFADAFAKQTGDAKVYSEFLNIRNPIIFRSKDTSEAQNKLYDEISKVRNAAKRIEETYRYGDTLEQSVFQLACNDDEFNRKLLAGIRQGHPEYDGIVKDAEKWRELTEDDRRLSAKMDELRYSDSYELMRTEIAKMVGASARDANFGGLGMAYDNKGKSAGLYRAKLMAEGYDGVVIENTRFDRSLAGGDNTQIVAFEPNQIKSATSNSGAFSPAKESTLDSAPVFNPAAFLNYLRG